MKISTIEASSDAMEYLKTFTTKKKKSLEFKNCIIILAAIRKKTSDNMAVIEIGDSEGEDIAVKLKHDDPLDPGFYFVLLNARGGPAAIKLILDYVEDHLSCNNNKKTGYLRSEQCYDEKLEKQLVGRKLQATYIAEGLTRSQDTIEFSEYKSKYMKTVDKLTVFHKLSKSLKYSRNEYCLKFVNKNGGENYKKFSINYKNIRKLVDVTFYMHLTYKPKGGDIIKVKFSL